MKKATKSISIISLILPSIYLLDKANGHNVPRVGTIQVSELDGSFRRTLITGGIEKLSSIVVDPSEG